jgi:hypothetical protein
MKRVAGVSLCLVFVGISVSAATIEGTVKDAAGKSIADARIDHTGIRGPELKTDAAGRFTVTTTVPAIVIRKPGYESQRIRIVSDAHLELVLKPIQSTSRCRLAEMPRFQTKNSNDADYTAKWFYIDTADGPHGIVSGHGPTYSFGFPSDRHVWDSAEYAEFMDSSEIIDATGRSNDGKYWRSRSIFGASAQYYDQTREIAAQLDCVMDKVPVPVR